MLIIFIFIGLGFIGLTMITSAFVIIYLNKQEVDVEYTWFSIKVPYYVHQYAKLTKLKTGRTGFLTYLYVGSIICAVLSFIVFSYTK
ncbi:MAG TPA: hypothetical protein PLD62_07920 [Candidatus Cloacimonadota bacterium]|nr:hypothetical protein [Candidatus Cloacimonadota bacterium]